MWRGVKFLSGADPPLEVVSGPYYWQIEPVWMDKPAAQSRGVSVVQTDNWLNLIKTHVPESNVTWPNNSNVVSVTVFGNLYEKNTTDISGEASVLQPVLPTIHHISAWKTVPVTGKKLQLTECLWWKLMTAMVSPSDQSFSELSPRKQLPSPRVSQTASAII